MIRIWKINRYETMDVWMWRFLTFTQRTFNYFADVWLSWAIDEFHARLFHPVRSPLWIFDLLVSVGITWDRVGSRRVKRFVLNQKLAVYTLLSFCQEHVPLLFWILHLINTSLSGLTSVGEGASMNFCMPSEKRFNENTVTLY